LSVEFRDCGRKRQRGEDPGVVFPEARRREEPPG